MFFDDDTPPEERPHPVEYPIRLFLVGLLFLLGAKAYNISDFGWLLMVGSWFLAIANLAVWPRMTVLSKPKSNKSEEE